MNKKQSNNNELSEPTITQRLIQIQSSNSVLLNELGAAADQLAFSVSGVSFLDKGDIDNQKGNSKSISQLICDIEDQQCLLYEFIENITLNVKKL